MISLLVAACAEDPGGDSDVVTEADTGCWNARAWYPDADGDGYGDFQAPVVACAAPEGHGEDFGDCDDATADVHPGADESTCDGIDSDCDGNFDEDAPDARDWNVDADGDGFGDPDGVIVACSAPVGAVSDATDCDDAAATAHPGGEERCGDGLDGDCDGVSDGGCGGARTVDLSAMPRWYGEIETVVVYGSGGSITMALASGGDTTGDGLQEVVLGLYRGVTEDWQYGAAVVLSPNIVEDRSFAEGAYVVSATEPDSNTADAVAFLSDADGDGDDELAIGAPWSSEGGTVYIVAGDGAASRTVEGSRTLLHGSADAWAGTVIADGGNVLGAGGALLVGAPRAAAVYAVDSSRTGDIDLAAADAILTGAGEESCLGEALADAGDTDGDGIDDLAVTAAKACRYFDHPGDVYLFRGPLSGVVEVADAELHVVGEWENGALGLTVAGAGDVDGDGLDDLAIGEPHASTYNLGVAGNVYVASGAGTGEWTASELPIRIAGLVADGALGQAIAAAGDADGDGRSDLAIGVPYRDTSTFYGGGAYLVSGIAAGVIALPGDAVVLESDVSSSRLGAALTAGVDTDGDGFDEIYVGGIAEYFGEVVVVDGARF